RTAPCAFASTGCGGRLRGLGKGRGALAAGHRDSVLREEPPAYGGASPLDQEEGPTGSPGATWTFDVQELRRPLFETVIGSGWVWQRVVWDAPPGLRWLAEESRT